MHPVDVHDRRVRQHRLVGRRQPVVVHLVILVAHYPRDRVPVLDPRARIHPRVRVLHDPGVGRVVVKVRLVHLPQQRVLRVVDRRVAEEHRRLRRLRAAQRVGRGVLVAHDHAVGHPRARGLVADLPVDAVGIEKRQALALGERRRDVGAHLPRPVLVVVVAQEDLAVARSAWRWCACPRYSRT